MTNNFMNMTGRELGQYELTERIGKGGMSAVYRARQPSLNRDVAVKVMASAFAADPSYAQRFVLEAKTAASLEHNNIVPLYDYGTADDDISYIVMRLLTGGTLGQRIENRVSQDGPLPSTGEAVMLLNEVAKALAYAHSRGIIHRDIKANNIMFDTQGDPYVVDFGIARAVKANMSLTADNVTVGTPTYMAPEQWRDEDLTPAVDQYALGVLMFYTLTGRLPFYGSNPPALMQKHINEAPPTVTEFRDDLPMKINAVIDRALSKDPDDRYANVTAFAESFAAALKGVDDEATDFFRFVLPSTGASAAGFRSPTVPAQPTPEPAEPASAAQTVPAKVSATPEPARQTVKRPIMEPKAPVPPPQGVPPVQRPPRRNNAVFFGGLAVLFFIGLAGAVAFLLMISSNPSPRAGTSVPSDATANTPSGGGIRINPSPGAVTEPGGGEPGSEPTAITVVGPGANPRVVGSGDVLFSQLQIVVRAVDITSLGVVVSGHADGRVRMWTSGTGADPIVLREHTTVVNDIDVSANGAVMVTGSDDNTMRVWDAVNASYRGVLAGHTGAVRGVAINADGTQAASASEDGTVRLWDVNAGVQTRALSNEDDDRFLSVTFSPDGRFVVAGDDLGNLYIWDAASGQRDRIINAHTQSVRSVDYSPDGSRLATSSTDDTVRIWDVENWSTLATLRGHNNDVWRVRFSPDGRQVASGGRDNNLRVWDANSGQMIQTYTGHIGWVIGVAYAPGGDIIATGGGDGAVRLWAAPD